MSSGSSTVVKNRFSPSASTTRRNPSTRTRTSSSRMPGISAVTVIAFGERITSTRGSRPAISCPSTAWKDPSPRASRFRIVNPYTNGSRNTPSLPSKASFSMRLIIFRMSSKLSSSLIRRTPHAPRSGPPVRPGVTVDENCPRPSYSFRETRVGSVRPCYGRGAPPLGRIDPSLGIARRRSGGLLCRLLRGGPRVRPSFPDLEDSVDEEGESRHANVLKEPVDQDSGAELQLVLCQLVESGLHDPHVDVREAL